jgi:hypothetical protein
MTFATNSLLKHSDLLTVVVLSVVVTKLPQGC